MSKRLLETVFTPEQIIRQLVLPVVPVEKAFQMIGSVHVLIMNEKLRIYHRQHRGAVSGKYYSATKEISVNAQYDAQEFTVIHEYGHFLDFVLLSDTGRACSCTPLSKLSRIIKMLRATPTYDDIVVDEDTSKTRIRYYRSAKELWARAYTQFIVTKAAQFEPTLAKRIFPVHMGWPSDEFQPVGRAIEDLFDSLGWMKTRI